MFRTHTCGELRLSHTNKSTTLAGWVQRVRQLGGMTFVDLRDRYGITQLVFNQATDAALCNAANQLGREFVVSVTGVVCERSSKNANLPTGDIEIAAQTLTVLNASELPPFTIETETDGGDELRMKYRYLDLRRPPVQNNLILRHNIAQETRRFLCDNGFLEIETPFLIKSTPEGARDFVVPSRMNQGQFYALPQSPQTFKQLLMVSGYDKYFQIVRCFRDEDLRADRQPEFTQIDCEMAFVEREDVLQLFEALLQHIFKYVKQYDLGEIVRMSHDDAMRLYGIDKPDIRFGLTFTELNQLAKGKGFGVFDEAELIVGICAPNCAEYTRKQLDELTDWVKRPQIGAKGLVYVQCKPDGTYKSSVDKFYSQADLAQWAAAMGAKPGDLLLVLSGETYRVRKQLGELRLHIGTQLGLRNPNEFKALWVLDFPLLEWVEEDQRYIACHHPFTRPKATPAGWENTPPDQLKAEAYDLVLNGNEIAGGSIRIHERALQEKMFELLGIGKAEAEEKFGFLMKAFQYGAPPHGGLAFGFDRLCAILGGSESIRDFIAFPKNNSGRDTMLNAPSGIDEKQYRELQIASIVKP
ncbi:MAG: aspartate--tRNA ligase [Sphingobacteriales bacterium]|nr:aspartate--tRNA ligase [Sphingobacteriales bacterium]